MRTREDDASLIWQVAGRHGTIRSFDLNYRSKVQPDKEKARATNKVIMQHLDIVVGNQASHSTAEQRIALCASRFGTDQ